MQAARYQLRIYVEPGDNVSNSASSDKSSEETLGSKGAGSLGNEIISINIYIWENTVFYQWIYYPSIYWSYSEKMSPTFIKKQ